MPSEATASRPPGMERICVRWREDEPLKKCFFADNAREECCC